MKPELVIDKREVLPDGTVRWYRKYADGFGCGGSYHPERDAVLSDRAVPVFMEHVSSSAMQRIEDAAATEEERAYLESKWDATWASE